MKVETSPRFNRDLRRIREPAIARRVIRKIEEIEAAASIGEVANVRRMNTASGRHYRIRIGDYRMGVTLDGATVVLHRLLPRDEIYRRFP